MNGDSQITATMFKAVETIPLNEALLCVNCGVISRSTSDCICCGSQSLLHLARVLGEEENSARSTMPTGAEAEQEENAGIMPFRPFRSFATSGSSCQKEVVA